jgi:hypothetical protein
MGGRKKKLKRSVATIEDSAASRKPHVLAMASTNSKYAKPMVVELTGMTENPIHVISATPIADAVD